MKSLLLLSTFIHCSHIIYGTSRVVLGGKNMLKTSDLNVSDTQMTI
ncbi:hypothetical protein UFO1_2429 [Pelosinus sp. UFO1]|nr:hypothetical protein UFO1_2429 [Pelosinus sp. UFO1]